MNRKPHVAPIKKTPSGFTLIELVIVISILSILSSFAIVGFMNFKTSSRNSKLEALTHEIELKSASNLSKILGKDSNAIELKTINSCENAIILLYPILDFSEYTISGTINDHNYGAINKCNIKDNTTSTILNIKILGTGK